MKEEPEKVDQFVLPDDCKSCFYIYLLGDRSFSFFFRKKKEVIELKHVKKKGTLYILIHNNR
jgi:hypothetical protein